MMREAAQNTIVHIKYLLNKNNKKVERHKRKLTEYHQNIGAIRIKYGCQTNLDERSHTNEN